MPESFYVTWCYCVPKIIYVRVSSRCSFSFNEKPGTFSENFCLWPEAVQKWFIQNGVLKICTKFTEEHQRYITMLLKWHFQLWSVNLLHIFVSFNESKQHWGLASVWSCFKYSNLQNTYVWLNNYLLGVSCTHIKNSCK